MLYLKKTVERLQHKLMLRLMYIELLQQEQVIIIHILLYNLFIYNCFIENQAKVEDIEGPTKEEMLQDLQSKTKQLDHAQKVISEQQRIIAENQPKPEPKGVKCDMKVFLLMLTIFILNRCWK